MQIFTPLLITVYTAYESKPNPPPSKQTNRLHRLSNMELVFWNYSSTYAGHVKMMSYRNDSSHEIRPQSSVADLNSASEVQP